MAAMMLAVLAVVLVAMMLAFLAVVFVAMMLAFLAVVLVAMMLAVLAIVFVAAMMLAVLAVVVVTAMVFAFLAVVLVAFAFAVAAMTFVVDVAVLDFFGFGVADFLDLNCEIEIFARHIVVEIHLDCCVGDGDDVSHQMVAVVVLHRDAGAYFHHFLREVGKCLARDVHNHFLVVFAVAFFGRQVETYRLSFFEIGEVVFKFLEHHTASKEELQKVFAGGLLHDGAAFLRPEGVVDGHYFVLFYFHYCLININYFFFQTRLAASFF